MAKGIDISSFQTTNIDFQKVKNDGISFVIVRAGFGERESVTFRPQAEGALAAGLDVGVYWYSYAVTVQEGIDEAKKCLSVLEPFKGRFTFPVWFDQEYEPQILALTRQQRTDICKGFMDTVQEAKWYTGLYSSLDWLLYKVYDSQLTAYDKWVAQYAPQLQYTGEYGIWQYSGSGRVAGIPVAVDLDESFKDYPSIIKNAQLNGWGPVTPPTSGCTVTVEEAVRILKAAGVTDITLSENCAEMGKGLNIARR